MEKPNRKRRVTKKESEEKEKTTKKVTKRRASSVRKPRTKNLKETPRKATSSPRGRKKTTTTTPINTPTKVEKKLPTKTTSSESSSPSPVRITQTVAILIDGNNIEMSIHSMLNKTKAMINFDTLIPKLLKERGLNRLIYFREGKSISSKLAERLHNHYFGIVVPCHKSADIPLTIAATQISEKVDTIIILSGDADYVELVKHLSSRGVRVEIAAVEQTTSAILREAADHFFAITKEDCFVRN